MKLLITGANGQLGTDLQALCGHSGDEVHALGHDGLDVGDRDAVLQAFGVLCPDVVIHAGAWTNVDGCETDPDKAYRVNSYGTRNIAEGSSIVGAHMVYVSTDYVFDGRGSGPNGGEPYSEWDAPAPTSNYGRSKLGGEQEVAALLGAAGTVVRTSWVVGLHGSNFLKTMLRIAANGENTPVTVVDDQHGCPSFTTDLAVGLRRLAAARMPGTFHLTNTGAVSWCGLAKAIFAIAGYDPARVVPITTDELVPRRLARRPAYSVLNDTAWRYAGFSPMRPWQEALEETLSARITQ